MKKLVLDSPVSLSIDGQTIEMDIGDYILLKEDIDTERIMKAARLDLKCKELYSLLDELESIKKSESIDKAVIAKTNKLIKDTQEKIEVLNKKRENLFDVPEDEDMDVALASANVRIQKLRDEQEDLEDERLSFVDDNNLVVNDDGEIKNPDGSDPDEKILNKYYGIQDRIKSNSEIIDNYSEIFDDFKSDSTNESEEEGFEGPEGTDSLVNYEDESYMYDDPSDRFETLETICNEFSEQLSADGENSFQPPGLGRYSDMKKFVA